MTEKKPRACSVDGCSARYFGRGYCGKHYQRVRTHGHVEWTRPDSWGTRKKHPLYQTWQNMLRRSAGCEGWGEFSTFLGSVGERPSIKHGLYPVRPHEPIGPKNFRWVLCAEGSERPRRRGDSCRVSGCTKAVHAADLCPTHHARWIKTGSTDDPQPRLLDPEKKKRKAEVERLWKYKLTPYEFAEMLDGQGGKCKICRGEQQGGKPMSVDHCHKTGVVRGLLCGRCNAGIGMLGDSVETLFSAIAYLSAHKAVKRVS